MSYQQMSFIMIIQSIIRHGDMGVLAVEMESAALYMNAARLSKRALAMFTISDNLMNGQSLSVEERQEGFDDMIKLSFETARLYNIEGGV